MKKHKLQLTRTTVQQLSAAQYDAVRGGIYTDPRTQGCASKFCLTPQCPTPSKFDSCFNTDCCLEVP